MARWLSDWCSISCIKFISTQSVSPRIHHDILLAMTTVLKHPWESSSFNCLFLLTRTDSATASSVTHSWIIYRLLWCKWHVTLFHWTSICSTVLIFTLLFILWVKPKWLTMGIPFVQVNNYLHGLYFCCLTHWWI